MICPLCGFEFNEKIEHKSCPMCALNSNCRFVKCPNCNYEIPAESKLITKFKSWRKEKDAARNKIKVK